MDASTLDLVRLPVIVLDREGRIAGWNLACAERTGRSRQEVLGLPMWEVLAGDDAPGVQEALSGLPHHAPEQLDAAWTEPDGAPRRLRWSIAAARADDGTVETLVLTGAELALGLPRAPPWKDVVERACWGVAVGGPDGRLAAVNPAYARMHRMTAEEIVGRPAVDMYPLERREETEEHIRLANERGKHQWESEHVRADGSVFPVLVDATAVHDETGRVAWQAVYVQDISDRKRAEQDWRELFELASDAIFLADRHGRFIEVNRAATELLGYTREELLGRTNADLLGPEERARLAEVREELLAGKVNVAPWTLRRKDGTWVTVEASAKILEDGRWQATARDVTERLQAEAALVGSEAKYRTILAIATDAVVSVDDDQRIVLFNEGAERIFGWPAAEVCGRPLDLLIPERYRATHRDQVRAFGDSGVQSREMAGRRMVRAQRRDGREFWAQAAISQFEYEGRKTYTAVMRDMSEVVRRYENERFLSQVGAVLASSLDVEVTLTEVGRLALAHLADLCILDVVRGSEIKRLRVLARDGASQLAERLEAAPFGRDKPHLFSTVYRSREPELIEELDPTYLRLVAQSPERLRLFQELAPKSALILPLSARGRLLGAVALLSSERRYDQHDLQLGIQLADRAAQALDNAHLHEALTRSNADLRVTVRDLQESQARVRTLTGLLPSCAWCGRIHGKDGGWMPLERYVAEHTAAEFTHGICPECSATQFPFPPT